MTGLPYARQNTFHGPKRQLLGNQAGLAPPAWRTANVSTLSGMPGKGKNVAVEQGSKIFLSRLPVDVGEKEVEELFRKTVGPLKECFLIYNSQGKSKGMAVVTFQRPGDASSAKVKYDGKIVDGRRPLKIEIIVDSASSNVAPSQMTPPSLLHRLGAKSKPSLGKVTHGNGNIPPTQPRQQSRHPSQAQPTVASVLTPVPPRRVRHKKGAKRIKKLIQNLPVTRDQLDKEMEDYRAAADTTSL